MNDGINSIFDIDVFDEMDDENERNMNMINKSLPEYKCFKYYPNWYLHEAPMENTKLPIADYKLLYHYHKREYQECIEMINQIENNLTKDMLDILINSYLEIRMNKEAVDVTRKYLQNYLKDTGFLNIASLAFIENENWEECLSVCKLYLAEKNDDYKVLSRAGLSSLRMNLFCNAREYCEKALSILAASKIPSGSFTAGFISKELECIRSTLQKIDNDIS